MSIGTPVLLFDDGTGFTVNFPATTIADAPEGSLIAVAIFVDDSTNPISAVDSAGNTYEVASNLLSASPGPSVMAIAFCINSAFDLPAGGTITVSQSGGTGGVFAYSVSGANGGLDPSTPYASPVVNNPASATSAPVLTGTLANANTIVFGIWTWFTNDAGFTESSGFTDLFDATHQSNWGDFAYKITNATTAVTYAPTVSTAQQLQGMILAFQASDILYPQACL